MANKKETREKYRDLVLKEYKKGNIVYAGIEGLMIIPLNIFLKQPIEGILYDLNRDEPTVLTWIDNTKWVNDFAVCKVIRELKKQVEELQKGKKDK
jgi:hypothetical protein